MAEPLGAMLSRLREHKGYTQLQLAEKLCELAETPTVTRNEVSRWEREDRVPSDFWLGWMSKVLEVPVTELQDARARSKRKGDNTVASTDKTPGTKWRDYSRSLRESQLALVTLKFEHRATSVQLSGTYEEPHQATAAIGMFRRMVAPGPGVRAGGEPGVVPEDVGPGEVTGSGGPSGARPGQTTGGSRANGARPHARAAPDNTAPAKRPPGVPQRPPTKPPPGAQPRPLPPPAAALPTSSPAGVPMGIRYTSGPGVTDDGPHR
jgi:transcriptional regulator with XRE-family HTH domain